MADVKISALTSYTTPLNADVLPIVDTANTTTKKVTWANIKATLKTYFDTLYPTGSGTSSGTNTGDQTSIVGITGTKAQFNTAVTDGDIVYLDSNDTVAGVKTYNDATLKLAGATSGASTLKAPAIASTYTHTLPAMTTILASVGSTTETTNTATVVAISGIHHTHTITALAAGNTFGVPTVATGALDDTCHLIIRIKDNATARALTWNAIFRASSDLSLPSTTIISKTLYVGFKYNVADTKWDLLAVLNNF